MMLVLVAVAASAWRVAANDTGVRQGNAGVPTPGAGTMPAEAPAAEAPVVELPKRDAPVLRDPTEPGEEMRDLVAPLRLGQPGGPAGWAVGRVTLKGRIIGPLVPPAAIIDLQGSVFVVTKDSELTVDTADSPLGGTTLRVIDVSVSEVRIEVLPFRKVVILR
jgi:hypothetical protein